MRKIWNFAMAAIVIVASAGLFTACDKENSSIYNDYWDNKISGLEKSEFLVTDVMLSVECWYGSMKFYTEPNGKGKEYIIGTPREDGGRLLPSGARTKRYAFAKNIYKEYTRGMLEGGIPHFYGERVMSDVVDNYFTVELDTYTSQWKVIGYDDNNIIVETDRYNETDENGIEYPYCIIHYKKVPFEDWMNECITLEEYTKKQGEYIASLPIEDLESLIRAWLEKSNYTVEVLEELFMELCPEYYESTIKYILKKYK